MNIIEKDKEKVKTEYLRKSGYINSIMSNFEYGKDIRVYGMKNLLISKKTQFDKGRIDISTKVENARFISKVVILTLVLIRDVIFYIYLLFSVIVNQLSVANFTLYLSIFNCYASGLEKLLGNVASINFQCKYIGDFRKFVELENETKECDTICIPKSNSYLFEFKNVYFKYPKSTKYIIKNLSIEIHSGQKLAIVGGNGAGKTTLIKLLTGLYSPSKGEVLLNGINITKFDKKDYYKLFSVVFQEIKIFSVYC